jgi:uncharacterized RDD family membrane protein YckC
MPAAAPVPVPAPTPTFLPPAAAQPAPAYPQPAADPYAQPHAAAYAAPHPAHAAAAPYAQGIGMRPGQLPYDTVTPLPAARTHVLATFAQRMRALSIDTLIVLVPTAALLTFIVPVVKAKASADPKLAAEWAAMNPDTGVGPHGREMHWAIVMTLVCLAAYWVVLAVYSGLFMSQTNGQTPGRKAVGIRVMREDGGRISFAWAVYRVVVVRELLFNAVALVTFGIVVLAQYLWPLWDHERRALHDFVAHSRVVVDADHHS